MMAAMPVSIPACPAEEYQAAMHMQPNQKYRAG